MPLKIITWNVNGLRAAIKKGFWQKIQEINPDIICLQETKSDSEIMTKVSKDEGLNVWGDRQDIFEENPEKSFEWNILWHSCSMKKGYSGVATLWKNKPKLELKNFQTGFGIQEFDIEGRFLNTGFNYEGLEFNIFNAYYPQGGRGPHRIDYKIQFYKQVQLEGKKLLDQGKSLILCGDLNTTVKDIDLARPKENRLTTGCLPEERAAFSWLIKEDYFLKEQLQITNPEMQQYQKNDLPGLELIDGFRHFYPDLEGKYSYWDQITRARERNVGWRIDYFLISQSLERSLLKVEILDMVMGSDHAPVELEIK